MSGGSYEYLCFADADEVRGKEEQVRRMADRLSALGYADDAAAETMDLLLTLRQQRVYVQSVLSRLSGIWHSVEWWDSGDSGEDGLEFCLRRYRHEEEEG